MHDLELYYREELINYVVTIVQNSATVCLIYKNNKKLQQANATATVYAFVANESTLINRKLEISLITRPPICFLLTLRKVGYEHAT